MEVRRRTGNRRIMNTDYSDGTDGRRRTLWENVNYRELNVIDGNRSVGGRGNCDYNADGEGEYGIYEVSRA